MADELNPGVIASAFVEFAFLPSGSPALNALVPASVDVVHG
jgi:hypothetical protein